MIKWNKLIVDSRLGLENRASQESDDIRSIFQRDYDRIIFSSPFRRLQDKTQVFPLPGSIFVHNRLTHSLEVASVGRSLGNLVTAGLQDLEGRQIENSLSEIGLSFRLPALPMIWKSPIRTFRGERNCGFFQKGRRVKIP